MVPRTEAIAKDHAAERNLGHRGPARSLLVPGTSSGHLAVWGGTGESPLCRGHRVGFLLHSREHPSKWPVAGHCTCLTDRETKVWRGETVSPSLESNGRQSQRPHLKRDGNSDAGVMRTASAVKGARRKGPSAVWFHSQEDLEGSDSGTHRRRVGGGQGQGQGVMGSPCFSASLYLRLSRRVGAPGARVRSSGWR